MKKIILFFSFLSSFLLTNEKSFAVEYFWDFSSIEDFQFNGSAFWDGDKAILTPDSFNQVGDVVLKDSIDISRQEKITVEFDFYAGDKDVGADGLTFFLSDINNGLNVLGAYGGGLGYEGIQDSLAVEFDTYRNYDVGDPINDHVGIDINGNINSIITTDLPNIEDNQEHHAKIEINLVQNIISVYIDDNLYIDAYPLPSLNLSNVYVGFSAGTGGRKNLQYIDNFKLVLIPKVIRTDLITPEKYDFGNVWKGQPSEPVEIVITNILEEEFGIKGVYLRGKFANNFEIVEDNCSGLSLQPSESCEIYVRMNPAEVGSMKAALKIITDKENMKKLYCHLKGIGRDVAEPDINSRQEIYDFGDIPVGVEVEPVDSIISMLLSSAINDFVTSLPYAKLIDIQNVGDSTLRIDKVVLRGRDSEDFNIIYNDCSNKNLEPSEICFIITTFRPGIEGYKKAVLKVLSNDPDEIPFIIKMKGNGTILETDIGDIIGDIDIPTDDIDLGGFGF